jgi:hypothetical protein
MNQVVYKQACQTALHLSASHLPNENGSVLQNNRFQTSEFFNLSKNNLLHQTIALLSVPFAGT